MSPLPNIGEIQDLLNRPPERYLLEEGQRQAVLLALAELALSRPGWDHMLPEIAVELRGQAMFEAFKLSNGDRVKQERGPLGPRP